MFFFRYFIIFGVIFSQFNFQIDKFYESPPESPFLTFDHINNTAYYFNIYNPIILEDGQILDIKINGSTFSPLGTYDINPLYKNIYLDSLLSNEFEHKRGDYGYYENTIVINNKNSNNVSAFLMLHGRTQPRYYSSATRGMSLQNHLFNINKLDKNSKISFSFMYHKEDITFPINSIDIINRFSDSYMLGSTFEFKFDKFYLNSSYSSQFINGNHYLNHSIDEFNQWLDLKFNFKYHNYFYFCTSIDYKAVNYQDNSIDINDNTDFLNFSLFNRFSYKNLVFDIGLDNIYLNGFWEAINPYLDIGYNLNNPNINLSFSSKNINYINLNNENINLSNTNSLHSFIFEYKKNNLKLNFEPFYLDVNNSSFADISGIRINTEFNNNIILSNINSTIYSEHSNLSFNSYVNYSFLIAPPIKNNRFRVFAGIDGTLVNIKNSNLFDPYTFDYSDILNSDNSKFVKQLNFKFGFMLERFKVTFNYINFMNDNISFTFDNRYKPLNNFFGLEVNWQFLD